MQGQPNSPYVFDEDVQELHGPRLSNDEIEEFTLHDPEEREVVIVDGEAMSYRAYHRR
ncbi:hypothetical protein SAMN04488063_1418 [Halopelagius inordinatus]|uniref:Uncharacterized protein n=1 Tax=Halopelagius inordinatus TaxID=553467 RepID=A0A1I2P341_9EURY|nr:hypothetical protein [Halopelagius inordinatus]SFG10013.1 hypothetical protein SAMN04488063_1418 [Halopelagius inordinatus]